MIVLTNLHGEQLAINGELIERVEGDHETRVILTSGTRYIVAETFDDVVRRCRYDRAEVLALSRALVAGFRRAPAPDDVGEDDEEEDDSFTGPGPDGREVGELRVLRPLDLPEGGAG